MANEPERLAPRGDSRVDRSQLTNQNYPVEPGGLSHETRPLRCFRLVGCTQRPKGLMVSAQDSKNERTCTFTPLEGWAESPPTGRESCRRKRPCAERATTHNPLLDQREAVCYVTTLESSLYRAVSLRLSCRRQPIFRFTFGAVGLSNATSQTSHKAAKRGDSRVEGSRPTNSKLPCHYVSCVDRNLQTHFSACCSTQRPQRLMVATR